MTYADNLRSLATWLDSHPGINEAITSYEGYPMVYLNAGNPGQFGQLVKEAGPGTKSGYDGTLTFRVTDDDSHSNWEDRKWSLTLAVTGACERTQTGKTTTRHIPIPATAYQNNAGEWVVDEPEYVYDCPDSFIGLASSE